MYIEYKCLLTVNLHYLTDDARVDQPLQPVDQLGGLEPVTVCQTWTMPRRAGALKTEGTDKNI